VAGIIVAALLVLSAATWGITIWQASASDALMNAGVPMALGSSGRFELGSAVLFLAIWLAMMAAMMLPSVWPAVLAYAKAGAGRRDTSVPLFVAGYLLVWECVGVLAYVAYVAVGILLASMPDLAMRLPVVAGVLIVVAGLYEFSLLKTKCLEVCQRPSASLEGSWRDGAIGGLSMGLKHGMVCLGCCSGLMVVLFALGAMDLRWMVAVAALIALEKLGPRMRLIPLVVGAGLVAVGVVVALMPPPGMPGM
jgi:predicted metal-binding membrane protein